MSSTEHELVEGSKEARYRAVARLVEKELGLDLDKYAPETVERLLEARPLGAEEARAHLVSGCSVGETMFMRHPEQIRLLCQMVSAPFASRSRLLVWSAGCASGEEAYSLAGALLSHVPSVHVLGTDVNPTFIEQGRVGRYRAWSGRAVERAEVEGWLDISPNAIQVKKSVREHVELRVHNLVSDSYPKEVDVIFCRNVLLYFHERAAQIVLDRFASSLREGGLLFVGYFDPAPREGGPWTEEMLGNTRYFRKLARPGCKVEAPSPVSMAEQALRAKPFVPASAPVEAAGASFPTGLAFVRTLRAEGANEEARKVLAELSRAFPLAVEPYVLEAMLAEDEDRFDLSLEAARRAHFLAPEEPFVQYIYGIALLHCGERDRAQVHLFSARGEIARRARPDLPLAYGEGMTGLELRRMIDVRVRDGL